MARTKGDRRQVLVRRGLVIKLVLEGLTYATVSQVAGFTVASVNRVIKENGLKDVIKTAKLEHKKALATKILILHKKGMKKLDICKELDLGINLVHRVVSTKSS